MCWARAGIFYGSDRIKQSNPTLNVLVPPLISSTIVQVINMPIIRASISLQNPQFPAHSTLTALQHIHSTDGIRGLYHGTSAGLLKTVPKYCTAIAIKDLIAARYPPPDDESATQRYARLASKAVISAVCECC